MAEVGKRRTAYATLNDKFSFLADNDRVAMLVQSYSTDLEEDFEDGFLLFRNVCDKVDRPTVAGMI